MLKKPILALAVRIALLRTRPRVVAITGSSGKTTTADALAKILGARARVGSTPDGSAGDRLAAFFGAVGVEKIPAAGRRKFFWKTFFRALFGKKLPEIVIVEASAAEPGSIRRIGRIFRPGAVILLNTDDAHRERYRSRTEIAAEKASLLFSLRRGGAILAGRDDIPLRAAATKLAPAGARLRWFGGESDADFRLSPVAITDHGIEFFLETRGERADFSAPVFGRFHAESLAAAAAAAREVFDIPLAESAELLRDFVPRPGRANILPGAHGGPVIDSSYNSTPAVLLEMLADLFALPGEKSLVLGDLRGLGDAAPARFETVAKAIAAGAGQIRRLVLTGPLCEKFLRPALENLDFPAGKIFVAGSAERVPAELGEIPPGEIIFVKGAEAAGLERAVAAMLAPDFDPAGALCRR